MIRGSKVLVIFVLVVLIVYLFHFAKIRKQYQTVIEQNDKNISLRGNKE